MSRQLRRELLLLREQFLLRLMQWVQRHDDSNQASLVYLDDGVSHVRRRLEKIQ